MHETTTAEQPPRRRLSPRKKRSQVRRERLWTDRLDGVTHPRQRAVILWDRVRTEARRRRTATEAEVWTLIEGRLEALIAEVREIPEVQPAPPSRKRRTGLFG